MSAFTPTLEQTSAIDCATSCVITACPGSGKTAVVSEKVRNALPSLPAYKGVIAISYTNKASAELKKRCTKNATDVKRSFFGTIDKFCISEIVLPFLPHFFDGSAIQPTEVVKRDALQDEEKLVYDISVVDDTKFLSGAISLFQNGKIVLETVGRLAVEILSSSPACQAYLRARYSHVFIDEYQDSGIEQHRLFLLMRDQGLIAVAVGDVRQSIYAFAGRDPAFLKKLCEDDSGFEKFQLTQNHRSHPSIINYSNRLLDATAPLLPSPKEQVYRKSIDGGPAAIAAWIDLNIPKIVEVFKVKELREIGILVKTHALGTAIHDALKTKSKLARDSQLEGSKLTSSIRFAAILRMRLDPDSTIQALLDQISFSGDRPSKAKLRFYLAQCKSGPLESLVTNMIEAIKLIEGQDPHIDSLSELTAALLDQTELDSLTPPTENEVQLMTLHKSKGLEFDVVIHLDLYNWILPQRTVVPGDYTPHFENWEQCLNLHYVGVTRARKAALLITSTVRINSLGQVKRGEPSQFFELPGLDGLYKTLT